MGFREATEAEWRLAQNTDQFADAIQRRAIFILDALGKTFNGEAPGGVEDLIFTKKRDEPLNYEVTSKFGKGRFRFQWATRGTQIEMIGQLILERESKDALDRTVWQPCLLIQVPVSAKWSVGEGDKPSELATLKDSDRYFALGVMTKFAIMTGPVID